MSKKCNAIGILVCFYPEYKDKAISYLHQILSKVSTETQIYVVYNNQAAKDKSTKSDSLIDVAITGSNSGWEFSAWDEGLKEVLGDSDLNNDDILVFANDTFCHHWPFSNLNVNFISKAINNAESDMVVGDIKKFKEQITLNGVQADTWLASYLFSVRYQNVNYLTPFDKVSVDSSFKQSLNVNEGQITFGNSSNSIQQRLSGRLFPSKQGKGRYKSGDADQQLIKLKAFAIINEILLSAVAVERGGSLVSFHPYKWMRTLNRFRRKTSRLTKRLKANIKHQNYLIKR